MINSVIKNLEKNNIKAFYAKDKNEALEIVKTLLKDNETLSVGGSVTLAECKITDYLRCGKFNFLDRAKEGLSNDDIQKIYRDTFFADTYLSSANAITKDGYIYEVDGNGNRVSAILFGPKQVILVVGKNKIVENCEDAVLRVKNTAAPKNANRLSCETYCKVNGKCISLSQNEPELCDGCNSLQRICADYVFLGRQRISGRIKVILVDENLGY